MTSSEAAPWRGVQATPVSGSHVSAAPSLPRAPPESVNPWNQAFARRDITSHYQRVQRSRDFLLYFAAPAVVAGVATGLLLAWLQPPMVQTKPRNALDHGHLSPMAILGWSGLVSVLTLAVLLVLRLRKKS